MRTVSIVGARPQFIKLAPVSREMAAFADGPVEDTVIHTGQHYDPGMSEIFFDELKIPKPAVDLAVGSGSHATQTARMLEMIESELQRRQVDMVVIYGDTNSTIAGSLAAAKIHIPVAHIEAGLRSFDRHMPEEVNRITSDHLSDLLFAPTQTAMDNLEAENLGGRAKLVGDVMLDAVLFNRELAIRQSDAINRLNLAADEFAVVTLHRAANTDTDRLPELLEALNELAQDKLRLVFPMHPRTSARVQSEFPDWRPHARLDIVDPIGYLDMLRLLGDARLVLTDSGGLQKEAFFLGTPCITLRDETEWPETVDAGANILAGADRATIVAAARKFQDTAMDRTVVSRQAAELFGNGEAARNIVREIVNYHGG